MFVTFKVALFMYSHGDFLLHSIRDILPQNSSGFTPSGALWNLIISPVGEYLEGAHFTGFSFRQCSNHARTCRTLHPSGTAWKSQQDLTLQWLIARKDQLDSYETFIDATLDPS